MKNKRKREFAVHIQSKYFLKFAEAFERCNHGIISCLVLLKNLVYFLETDFLFDEHKRLNSVEAKQFQIRRDILRSIAGHSCDNIYYINIPQFGFLLMMIDAMQEWGRPRFADLFGKVPRTVVKIVKFDIKQVHYIVELHPPSDLGGAYDEVRQKMEIGTRAYFRKKCDWLFRTLRSAVIGVEERKIEVTCEVVNITDGKPESYKIVHKSPVNIEIYDKGKSIAGEWSEWVKKLEIDLPKIEGK
jgi:hypothetical protein